MTVKKRKKRSIKKIEEERLTSSIVKQLLTLSTSGFGLAAALAWNDTIKTFIEEFVKPYISGGSSLFSQLVYAIVITLLAVLVTYNLTRISKHLDKKASIGKAPTDPSQN